MSVEHAPRVVDCLLDANTTPDDIDEATRALLTTSSDYSPEQAAEAIAVIAEGIAAPEYPRSFHAALLCGAFMEGGCDPAAVSAPLLDKLSHMVAMSDEFVAECRSTLPDEADEEADEEAVEAAVEAAAEKMPDHADAYFGLVERFWQPTMALLSRHVPSHTRARSELLEPLTRVCSLQHPTSWYLQMLAILFDEPIVILEPATGLGVEGTVSGIADNFQLNTLIMDQFPNPDGQARVPETAAATARGHGDQQTEDVLTGTWNLCNWQAIQPDGSISEETDFWIWNEGSPADIEVFDGVRVVILADPTYPRSWGAQRVFDMPASLKIKREMSADEVTEWVSRLQNTQR